jgi:hypothetical protein
MQMLGQDSPGEIQDTKEDHRDGAYPSQIKKAREFSIGPVLPFHAHRLLAFPWMLPETSISRASKATSVVTAGAAAYGLYGASDYQDMNKVSFNSLGGF